MTAQLTERRKADRAEMARQVAVLARKHGLTAVASLERDRRVTVEVQGPRGLRVAVRFDGTSGRSDVYVLSWHGVEDGARLDPAVFADVNPYHGHKATDVARGWPQLLDVLASRFASIADGSAFTTPPTPAGMTVWLQTRRAGSDEEWEDIDPADRSRWQWRDLPDWFAAEALWQLGEGYEVRMLTKGIDTAAWPNARPEMFGDHTEADALSLNGGTAPIPEGQEP